MSLFIYVGDAVEPEPNILGKASLTTNKHDLRKITWTLSDVFDFSKAEHFQLMNNGTLKLIERSKKLKPSEKNDAPSDEVKMTLTIHVSESRETTAEEHARITGNPVAEPGRVNEVIAAVRMGVNEHGSHVVTWELEDHFTFSESQLKTINKAVVVLNDKFNALAKEETE